jgi:hypothetical protein
MLTPSYAKQFGKDLKRMLKGGRSEEKIREVLKRLVNEVKGGQIFIFDKSPPHERTQARSRSIDNRPEN